MAVIKNICLQEYGAAQLSRGTNFSEECAAFVFSVQV
jgi:hypothetical protein